MNIHGVPIHGRVLINQYGAIKKIEKVTTKEEWEGVKGIYSSNLIEEPVGVAGQYGSADNETAHMNLTLTHQDDTEDKFTLLYEDLPIILVSSGMVRDEYHFAFTILHELGHHNLDKKLDIDYEETEIQCNIFAYERLTKENFEIYRKINHKFEEESRERYNTKIKIRRNYNEPLPERAILGERVCNWKYYL